MKKSVKALLLTLCAVVLVVATVFTTLAFMTSRTNTITNTFSVGNISITLDEADVDEVGVLVSTKDVRVNENQTYKLVPGKEYVKDPTVHVTANSEDSWVFVKYTNTLEDGAIASGMTVDTENWNELVLEDVDYKVYYRQYAKNAEKVDYKLFTTDEFEVANITGETLNTKAHDKTISVQAFAIQDDGFDNASKAWEALKGDLPADFPQA